MSGVGEVSLFETGWIWLIIFMAPVSLFFGRKARLAESLLWIASVVVLTHAAMMCHVLDYWDLRSDRTFADPRATIDDMQAATADGANKVFTFLFGWIPALLWTVLWFGLWRLGDRLGRRIIEASLADSKGR
ncbi:MAG: hypothetical protein U5J99_06750 [Parvularculaceae bacterium]|nr:hypothetical protein [Parvularculaceae bacterium]